MNNRFLCAGTCALLVVMTLITPAWAEERSGSGGKPDASAIDLAARIVGGSKTRPGEWPAALSVVNTFADRSAFTRHYCGATLIAPQWALTAAHCLFEGSGKRQLRADQLRVIGGRVDLDTAVPEDEVVVVNVYVNPAYDNGNVSSRDDIGLIELAQPIDLPVVSLFDGGKESLVDRSAYIIGWGATSDSDDPSAYSPRQQAAQLPVVSEDQCNAPESYDGLVDESQLCAGLAEGGVDACIGDSGGPLIIGVDGFQVQVGVVSFGSGCAQPNFYGIYTNVAWFSDWIRTYVPAADFRSLAPAPKPDEDTDRGDDTDANTDPEESMTGGIAGNVDAPAENGVGAFGSPLIGLLLALVVSRRRGRSGLASGRRIAGLY